MVEEDSSDVLEALLLDLPDEPELPFEVQIEKKTIQRKGILQITGVTIATLIVVFILTSITIQNLTVQKNLR